jgi:hypothetical protein
VNEGENRKIAEVEGELWAVEAEERDLENLEQRAASRESELRAELLELEAAKTYTITVNREDFHDQPRLITGSHILDLAKQNDGTHGVAILRGGGEHDIPVEPNEKVDLEDHKNRRFKTFPIKSTEGC